MNFFKVDKCEFTNCPNYYIDHCFFDGKDITNWFNAVKDIKINKMCQIAKQVRLVKTRELLTK